MIVAAGFFVAGVGCSLALIIRELRKAPEGYEDEHGFYIVRNGAVKDDVPDLDEVSQIGGVEYELRTANMRLQ